MRKVNYNIGTCLMYQYASFCSDYSFENSNFDELLKVIGTHYFHQPDANINKICGLIRDDINRVWHLNRARKIKQGKRVSANQIKTIRRSFNKLITNSHVVLIPFEVVSILFYILSLLKSLDTNIPEVKKIIALMNKNNVGDTIYKDHLLVFSKKFAGKRNRLTEECLMEKYDNLKDKLDGFESLMNRAYDRIPWNELPNFKL